MTCRGGPCCNGKHHILVKNEDIPQDAKIVERNFTQRVEQERVIRMERLAQRKATSRTNKVSVDWVNPDYATLLEVYDTIDRFVSNSVTTSFTVQFVSTNGTQSYVMSGEDTLGSFSEQSDYSIRFRTTDSVIFDKQFSGHPLMLKDSNGDVLNDFNSMSDVGQQTYQFTTPGVYEYFCTAHPTDMVGQITIVQSSDVYIAEKVVIGQSYLGRDIVAVRISAEGGSPKPCVYINGTQHAREWLSPMSCLYFMEVFVPGNLLYALTNIDIWIIPCVNPDGYDYTHTTNPMWRKNRQSELGTDEVGTDLNRNWGPPEVWELIHGSLSNSVNPSSEVYRGEGAFSAPETLAVSNHMNTLLSILGYVDIHAYAYTVMGNWGWTNSDIPNPDCDIQKELGISMADAMGFVNANGAPAYGQGSDWDGDEVQDGYMVTGDAPGWVYEKKGAMSYTYEVQGDNFWPPASEIPSNVLAVAHGLKKLVDWAFIRVQSAGYIAKELQNIVGDISYTTVSTQPDVPYTHNWSIPMSGYDITHLVSLMK